MHGCAVGSDQYEKDVKKVLERWRIHPDYAVFCNDVYQDMLHKIERFQAEQNSVIEKEGQSEATGISRGESAELLIAFLTHTKEQMRNFLNERAKK
ncbi:hypothetical protein [Novosphingobium sp. BL-52-GroH]|uniref:hypothetical protein n=1 Tax=Novosphingobium sp. BL-52-GroH TaxID=3349877 RepID=UPI0038515A0A